MLKKYVSLINSGGDYCGMGLAEKYPKGFDDEADECRASDVEYYKADEAQEQIDRLKLTLEHQQQEIGKLRSRASHWSDIAEATERLKEHYADLATTGRNDTLEAVAQWCERHGMAMQSGFRGPYAGYVTSPASPVIALAGRHEGMGYAAAIRAMKIPEQVDDSAVLVRNGFGADKGSICSVTGCNEMALDKIKVNGTEKNYCFECSDKIMESQKGSK